MIFRHLMCVCVLVADSFHGSIINYGYSVCCCKYFIRYHDFDICFGVGSYSIDHEGIRQIISYPSNLMCSNVMTSHKSNQVICLMISTNEQGINSGFYRFDLSMAGHEAFSESIFDQSFDNYFLLGFFEAGDHSVASLINDNSSAIMIRPTKSSDSLLFNVHDIVKGWRKGRVFRKNEIIMDENGARFRDPDKEKTENDNDDSSAESDDESGSSFYSGDSDEMSGELKAKMPHIFGVGNDIAMLRLIKKKCFGLHWLRRNGEDIHAIDRIEGINLNPRRMDHEPSSEVFEGCEDDLMLIGIDDSKLIHEKLVWIPEGRQMLLAIINSDFNIELYHFGRNNKISRCIGLKQGPDLSLKLFTSSKDKTTSKSFLERHRQWTTTAILTEKE